ncbi:EAL domain-containing protein [Cellulomonas bogoriensis]|nr:EAL domain-containing protein [Cellulomonas bogoriensis]
MGASDAAEARAGARDGRRRTADPAHGHVPSPHAPAEGVAPTAQGDDAAHGRDPDAETEPATPPTERPEPVETPLERFLYQTSSSHPWMSAATIAGMLAVGWLAVYASGGSQRALPHLFYVPILAAALPFGLRGVLVTGTVSTVLVGPLMPLDTSTGAPQDTMSWVVRGVMFLLIGSISAIALRARDRVYTRRLQEDLREALTRARLLPSAKDPALAEQVREVLDARRFHPVFQPIYSLRTGELVGVEALTRFDVEPYRSPDQWFAAAEDVGLGTDLEIAAIEAALAHPEVHGLAVSVNVSPATLADPRLLALATSCSGRTLTLEITEHAAIEDYRLLSERMEPLRRAGVRVAVDDVGAGFSSLKHIVQLAPDVIKLDMSLTQDVEDSPLRKALATSLVEFSEHTGAVLVVEGIETDQDLAAWAAMGAHAAQGYLIGRPGNLPVSAASSVIAQMRQSR